MVNIKTVQNYAKSLGMIEFTNDMNELTKSYPNGFRASIVEEFDETTKEYTGNLSIACFDYNGYAWWNKFPNNDPVICKTEEEAFQIVKQIYEFESIISFSKQ